ncbi:hypothetical protein NU08_3585 [Flavobacterium anhuiense]|uniref:Uncharacterized protein n=1 Tax=Flavobacterium anhuiense TaxID=459526 RepID=A0A444VVN8_9FLAO|nr:hypothetical protein [Flavobacterium anhuiense]RYJ37414.1 hypothetical protein NU08_3585 [Flavobacterium anhuiense]
MKIPLLPFMLCLAVNLAFGQTVSNTLTSTNDELPVYNLYYLSKYITSENLSSPQISKVYASLISSISATKADSLVLNYSPPQKTEETNYIGAFLYNDRIQRELIKKNIISKFSVYDFSDYDKIASLTDRLISLEEKSKEIRAGKSANDSIKIKISLLNTYKTHLEAQDTSSLSILDAENKIFLEKVQINQLSSSKKIEQEIARLKILTDEYNTKHQQFNKNVYEYADMYALKYDKTFHIELKNLTNPDITNSEKEIHINSMIQTAEQRAGTPTYSLPSESDMINAMAIFLAKRAQQETAIWFMDKIRENMKNPLIYEAFPETIRLIENLEDFKTPNFSVAWRYAIASDFVKMPINLANSSWVKNFILENNFKKTELLLTSTTFGYDINRLVAEKYNYRDIIRYFYTNPYYDFLERGNENQMKELLKNSISILYIITNELFAIDLVNGEKNYRLLSYEEISGMTQIQWRTLGQLIQLKYGNEKFASFFNDEFNECKEPLSKWVGNLLLSLSQFDKVNKDYQKTLEKKENGQNDNFYNVWQNTLQIIDNLDYRQYLSTDISPNKDTIEILKQGISIYENIQNKNYSEAIHKTLEMIDKIKITDKVNTHLQMYYDATQFNYKDGEFYFAISGVKYYLKNKPENQNLYMVRNQTDTICVLQNFARIRTFLKFIEPNKKNSNDELIKTIAPDFNTTIAQLSESLKIKNSIVLFMLKAFVLMEDNKQKNGDLDSQKLLNSLIRQQFSFVPNTKINNEQERIKLKYQDKLLKLTAFFGDILATKNADDLANVIDSHALPPTSYKLKRRVSRSIDLNGYVGIQGSRIWAKASTSLETQYTVGITAPIGFAYTWSNLKNNKPDNWGFTIDIIDLGNIVNHYLVNSNEYYSKDVHFSEVFSPAASFMYALRKTPFVVFAGCKLLPLKTSSITESDGSVKLLNERAFDATIFSVGIKIDIPLVNLWSTVL